MTLYASRVGEQWLQSWLRAARPDRVENALNRVLLISSLVFAMLSTACGVGGQPSLSRNITSSQALTAAAEWLEFETPAVRAELLRDVVRQSQLQAGRSGTVMFPMSGDSSGQLVAAPALDTGIDLLAAADAGAGVMLSFDTRGDRFGEDRRDAFQGLSEREATELVARSILAKWNVKHNGPVTVSRAAGAPYAAAWLDGTLRINPSFVYMAAAPATLAQ